MGLIALRVHRQHHLRDLAQWNSMKQCTSWYGLLDIHVCCICMLYVCRIPMRRVRFVITNLTHFSHVVAIATLGIIFQQHPVAEVGFILSSDLPCTKNIQKIVSVFANRTGRICILELFYLTKLFFFGPIFQRVFCHKKTRTKAFWWSFLAFLQTKFDDHRLLMLLMFSVSKFSEPQLDTSPRRACSWRCDTMSSACEMLGAGRLAWGAGISWSMNFWMFIFFNGRFPTIQKVQRLQGEFRTKKTAWGTHIGLSWDVA